MSLSITNIRSGLKTNLGSISGLQVSEYMRSNPTPPVVWVMGPETIEYVPTVSVLMVVQVFVGAVTDQGAQVKLDGYLADSGASSIKAAIESDRTLGGACSDCEVVRTSGYKPYKLSGRQDLVLGADFDVEVLV